jgi:hypothetical protein
MKQIQIQAHDYDNNRLLRAAGVKRISQGWYTVEYRGVSLDASTIVSAKRNRKGAIRYAPPTHPN